MSIMSAPFSSNSRIFSASRSSGMPVAPAISAITFIVESLPIFVAQISNAATEFRSCSRIRKRASSRIFSDKNSHAGIVFESSSSFTHERTDVRSYACLGPRRISVLHSSSRSVKSLDTRPGTRSRSYRLQSGRDGPSKPGVMNAATSQSRTSTSAPSFSCTAALTVCCASLPVAMRIFMVLH